MISSRARWRILLAAGSLLMLGAAAGVAVDRVAHQLHGNAGVIEFSEVHHDPVGIIDRVIDLRPDQRERVAAILASRQGDIDAAWHEARTRINATVDSVISEIAAVLDPEQAERFRRLADELHGHGRIRLPH